MDLYLSNTRYLAALRRMRDRIAGGLGLVADDDTTPGNKSTHCSWGMCSRDAEAWPDAEDHLWPDQFVKDGRVAPKYTERHQRCPLDKRAEPNGNGCFYTCRIFKSSWQSCPTREQALQFYDEQIARAEQTAEVQP